MRSRLFHVSILVTTVFASLLQYIRAANPFTRIQTWFQPQEMGQAMRIVAYDRAANERNAISALHVAGHPLSWFRLDDGVMGGQSETNHVSEDGILHFIGTINTSGGGFTSIRAKIPPGQVIHADTKALRVQFRGDGKTYKLLLSDGQRSTGGPMGRSPSWQADLPTQALPEGEWQTAEIELDKLLPNFGGSVRNRPPEAEKANYHFDASTMGEIGLMLSLKLSNGQPNPPATFGAGVFPFSLLVKSIEPLS